MEKIKLTQMEMFVMINNASHLQLEAFAKSVAAFIQITDSDMLEMLSNAKEDDGTVMGGYITGQRSATETLKAGFITSFKN